LLLSAMVIRKQHALDLRVRESAYSPKETYVDLKQIMEIKK